MGPYRLGGLAGGGQVQPGRADLGGTGPASSGFGRRRRGCETFLASCRSAAAHACAPDHFRRPQNFKISAAPWESLSSCCNHRPEGWSKPRRRSGQGQDRTTDLPLFRGPIGSGIKSRRKAVNHSHLQRRWPERLLSRANVCRMVPFRPWASRGGTALAPEGWGFCGAPSGFLLASMLPP
jgi:hypothetical protein